MPYALLILTLALGQNLTAAAVVSGSFVSTERPASVVLRTPAANPNAAPAGETPVNPDGTFNFSGVPSGIYVLQLGPTSSSRTTNTFRVDNSAIGLVVLTGRVTANDGSGLPSLTLPTVNISTTIEDRGTAPNGANPAVLASLAVPSDGLFALVLPDGDHTLGVRNLPLSHDVQSISIGDRELPGGSLRISPGMPSGELRIVLRKSSGSGVHVTGRVTGQFSDPATTSTLALQGIESGSHAASTALQSDGSFEFTAVPPGIYAASLRVRRPTGTPVVSPNRWWVRVHDQNIQGMEFSVRIEPRTLDGAEGGTPINVPLVTGRVTVLDESGKPRILPSGVMIGLSGNPASVTSIADDGAFLLPSANGDHSIVFSGLPAGFSIRTMTSGAIDLSRFPLSVAGGTAPGEIRIALEFNSRDASEGRIRLSNGTVSGRILGADGMAAPYMRVMALTVPSLISEPIASTLTSTTGSYSFENLPPGQYYLAVGPPTATAARVVTRRTTSDGTSISEFLPISVAYGQRVELGAAVAATEVVGRGQPSAVYAIPPAR